VVFENMINPNAVICAKQQAFFIKKEVFSCVASEKTALT
jgi:hypothetical protein